ncbi:MAG: glycosyltransferase [Geodermatophilaceae bacterium]
MRAAGIVVPVHDEEQWLARCLAAIDVAAQAAAIPVHLVLVLDACTDRSGEIAAAAAPEHLASTSVVAMRRRCVGAARALGCQTLLDRHGPDGLWLATTDADSTVGASWLTRSLAYAHAGYDAVAGTVIIDDWSPGEDELAAAYRAGYEQRWGHRHVHGANLAVTAPAYVEVGGFPALPCHEDVALVDALTAAGRAIAWADDVPVVTSSRRHGRTPGGLSGYLLDLNATGPEALPQGA